MCWLEKRFTTVLSDSTRILTTNILQHAIPMFTFNNDDKDVTTGIEKNGVMCVQKVQYLMQVNTHKGL